MGFLFKTPSGINDYGSACAAQMQGGFEFSVLERGLFGNEELSGKAAEDCRSPRRYREVLKRFVLRQFLDCGSPLPLFQNAPRCQTTRVPTPKTQIRLASVRHRQNHSH